MHTVVVAYVKERRLVFTRGLIDRRGQPLADRADDDLLGRLALVKLARDTLANVKVPRRQPALERLRRLRRVGKVVRFTLRV